MFYRFTKAGARISTDLDGLFEGSSLFLLGGNTKLLEVPLDLLRQPGIVTMAMNNVPCSFPRPTLWVAADKPPCFSKHIYASPEIMKFTMLSRCEELVGSTGLKVREFPNIYFFGVDGSFTCKNFLDKRSQIVWWKSVFPMALQLAYRLGFRVVYLVGCGFKMTREAQYAWKTDLSDYQRNYSQRTYNIDVDRLRHLKALFDPEKFDVISATPDSPANEILGYIDVTSAVGKVLQTFPAVSDTTSLVHSSALSKPGGVC